MVPETTVIIDVLDVNDNGPTWQYPTMPDQQQSQPDGSRNMYIGAIAIESKPDSPVLMPQTDANKLFPGSVFVSVLCVRSVCGGGGGISWQWCRKFWW